jgi:hypothetical protein
MMSEKKTIYCVECAKKVDARLTNGAEVYSHRYDLKGLPFWICDICNNFVGCHHKTSTPTKPLGVIANQELKNARSYIHKLLDPLWQNQLISRNKLYKKLSNHLGLKSYHTANIRSIEEARVVYKFLLDLRASIAKSKED